MSRYFKIEFIKTEFRSSLSMCPLIPKTASATLQLYLEEVKVEPGLLQTSELENFAAIVDGF